jgi:transcription termination factor Rho
MYDILQLNDMLVPELKDLAEQLGVSGFKKLTKQDLIYQILDHQAVAGDKPSKKSETSKATEKVAEAPQKMEKMEKEEKTATAITEPREQENKHRQQVAACHDDQRSTGKT